MKNSNPEKEARPSKTRRIDKDKRICVNIIIFWKKTTTSEKGIPETIYDFLVKSEWRTRSRFILTRPCAGVKSFYL